MKGSKIMVLKSREIIKTAIFAVIGIVLLVVLINLFIPKNTAEEESATNYTPGTYSVNILLSKGSVDVEVTVSENEITKVDFSNLNEDQQVFYPLFAPTMEIISQGVLETQSLEVVIPEECSVTGTVLLMAIDKALVQAIQ